VATKPTKKQTTQSVDPALVERSRAALHELPAELAKGETCEMVRCDGKTIGYVMLGVRRIRFYVPDGHGKIELFAVASRRDLAKAMSALKKAAERQAAKSEQPKAKVAT
jgi:hypothetical protein